MFSATANNNGNDSVNDMPVSLRVWLWSGRPCTDTRSVDVFCFFILLSAVFLLFVAFFFVRQTMRPLIIAAATHKLFPFYPSHTYLCEYARFFVH